MKSIPSDPATIKERDVKKAILARLKEMGWYAFPVNDKFRHGTLDLVAMRDGRTAWIEVKRPVGGAVTKVQSQEIERLRAVGIIAGVVTSVEELENLLQLDNYYGKSSTWRLP